MNPTNDDATKPIPQQGGGKGAQTGSTAPSNNGDSKLAALKGEVTSRIAAVKSGSDEPKSTSRSGKNTAGTGQATSRTAHTPSANNSGAADRPKGSGRRVRLTLARIDPWSVMKFSFLVAVAVGLATVIAIALLWNIVDAIGLWDQIKSIGTDLNNGKPLPFMEYFEFTKMISYGTVVAFLNVIIITALGTLLAFLYNIVAALLGGIKVTFTDN